MPLVIAINNPHKGHHEELCFRYIPGKIFVDLDPWTTSHFFQVGQLTARMDQALASFSHPALDKRESIWFLSAVPTLKEYFKVNSLC